MKVCSKEMIGSALNGVEARHGCRVLFAVESGSRAWGFASPDSDYDVRGVYVKPHEWYLQLREGLPDTIVESLPGDLDISLWDLRKALLQMSKSNASFLEWLRSPVVYRDDGLIGQLDTLKSDCFNPVHVAYHYASMFRKAMEARNADGSIRIKKLCYALRASLCLRYVMDEEEMPPTSFGEVRKAVDLSKAEEDAIQEILAKKESALECDVLKLDGRLDGVLADRYELIAKHPWRKNVSAEPVYRSLEELFRSHVTAFKG